MSFLKTIVIHQSKYWPILNNFRFTASECSKIRTMSTISENDIKSIPELNTKLESNGLFAITINRPEKANAFTIEMYSTLGKLISAADSNKAIKYVSLTGNGKYFSSGNELSNFKNTPENAKQRTDLIRTAVESVIKLTKPLFAFVNGPAIGIGATLLAHCDIVYSTESAYLLAPFSRLSICPEAGSSFLFPRIMGLQKATEFLMFNRKLTATEAQSAGLITRVIPDSAFQRESEQFLKEATQLPYEALLITKELLRKPIREELLKVNAEEFSKVAYLTTTDECAETVKKFLDSIKKK